MPVKASNMSVDLIENLDDDKNVTLSLELNARGHAFLTLYGVEEHEPYTGDTSPDMVTFHLSPNEQGHECAKIIENALREWREHTLEKAPQP